MADDDVKATTTKDLDDEREEDKGRILPHSYVVFLCGISVVCVWYVYVWHICGRLCVVCCMCAVCLRNMGYICVCYMYVWSMLSVCMVHVSCVYVWCVCVGW